MGLPIVLPLWIGNVAQGGRMTRHRLRPAAGGRPRATPLLLLLLLPHQTAARAKSTLEVQPRNTALCPPVDFTSLRDLRLVATVTGFLPGVQEGVITFEDTSHNFC